jgi:hypothetical protein
MKPSQPKAIMRPIPVKRPVQPSKAEQALKDALKESAKSHVAKLANILNIYPCL